MLLLLISSAIGFTLAFRKGKAIRSEIISKRKDESQ
jgi:hypothetical protein